MMVNLFHEKIRGNWWLLLNIFHSRKKKQVLYPSRQADTVPPLVNVWCPRMCALNIFQMDLSKTIGVVAWTQPLNGGSVSQQSTVQTSICLISLWNFLTHHFLKHKGIYVTVARMLIFKTSIYAPNVNLLKKTCYILLFNRLLGRAGEASKLPGDPDSPSWLRVYSMLRFLPLVCIVVLGAPNWSGLYMNFHFPFYIIEDVN